MANTSRFRGGGKNFRPKGGIIKGSRKSGYKTGSKRAKWRKVFGSMSRSGLDPKGGQARR